jgi:hypothetical protein
MTVILVYSAVFTVWVRRSSPQHCASGNLFAVGAAGGAMNSANVMNYQSFFLRYLKNP